MAEFDRNDGAAQWRPNSTGLKLLTRCHSLVATINGTPKPDPDQTAAIREWMAVATTRAAGIARVNDGAGYDCVMGCFEISAA